MQVATQRLFHSRLSTKTAILHLQLTRRQGYVAARNMAGKDMKMPRVSGTSGLSLFDYKFGQTGVHETEKTVTTAT